MIRTQCVTALCKKQIRAHKIHKYCRHCHFSIYGVGRPLNRIKKNKPTRTIKQIETPKIQTKKKR